MTTLPAIRRDSMLNILDAARPTDRDRWLRAWAEMPTRAPQAHPGYSELFAATGERPLAVDFVSNAGRVLFPLRLRHLADLPWTDPHDPRTDLAAPYGYGGPFYWRSSNPTRLASQFWPAFWHWARGLNAVTSFATHLRGAEGILPWPTPPSDAKAHAVRALDCDEATLWQRYPGKIRNQVRQAQRYGLRVACDPRGERIREFAALYASTMERNNADPWFHIPEAAFRALAGTTPDVACWFHALDGDEVIASILVLAGRDTLYYCLGGSDARRHHKRPYVLLHDAVMRWGIRTGRRAYVLGGGYRPGDGLYHFKRKLAGSEQMLRIAGWTLDPAAHNELVAARRRFSGSEGWTPRPGYFPTYRA